MAALGNRTWLVSMSFEVWTQRALHRAVAALRGLRGPDPSESDPEHGFSSSTLTHRAAVPPLISRAGAEGAEAGVGLSRKQSGVERDQYAPPGRATITPAGRAVVLLPQVGRPVGRTLNDAPPTTTFLGLVSCHATITSTS